MDTIVTIFDVNLNTLRPRQNGHHFPDDIFKCIFLNENVWISIKISLKFVPNGPMNNIPALVLIMAWRRPGDKLLSEPMMVSLPTHLCVTRPQWVNICQLFCHYAWASWLGQAGWLSFWWDRRQCRLVWFLHYCPVVGWFLAFCELLSLPYSDGKILGSGFASPSRGLGESLHRWWDTSISFWDEL